MRSLPLPLLRNIAFATALLAVACDDGPTAPGIQPQIVNDTDTFSYQISDLNDVTGTWDYSWQNTGTFAKVTHASDAGSVGTATVTIFDGAGTQVYAGALATTGETTSAPEGVAGTWTVRVTYSDYSNSQVNFAVIMQ